MTENSETNVYHQLAGSLVAVSEDIAKDHMKYERMLKELIRAEFSLKDRHGEEAVDRLMEDVRSYLDMIESLRPEIMTAIDMILDGLNPDEICASVRNVTGKFRGIIEQRSKLKSRIEIQLKEAGVI